MTSLVWQRGAAVGIACCFIGLSGCTPEAVYLRSLREVTLVSYSRLYPAYAETTSVSPGVSFPVGDGDFSARVIQYLPDFEFDTTGHARSRSDQPNNPAVRLEVLKGKSRKYFAWAFLRQGTPHFRAREDLAFSLQSLSLADGAKVTATELGAP